MEPKRKREELPHPNPQSRRGRKRKREELPHPNPQSRRGRKRNRNREELPREDEEAIVETLEGDSSNLEPTKSEKLEALSPDCPDFLRQIHPDSEIISGLKRYRDEYRSSHGTFGTTEDLKKVHLSKLGGSHIGVYSFAVEGFSTCDFSVAQGTIIRSAARFYDMHSPGDQALFILLVEDERDLYRLSNNYFQLRFPCIIISPPSGRPDDIATRVFVKKVHTELRLPVLTFGRCHPNWLSTVLLYQRCVHTTADGDVDLSIPDIKWLGLTVDDLNKYSHYFCQGPPPPKREEDPAQITDAHYHCAAEGIVHPRISGDPIWLSDSLLVNFYLPLKLKNLGWIQLPAPGDTNNVPPVPDLPLVPLDSGKEVPLDVFFDEARRAQPFPYSEDPLSEWKGDRVPH